MTDQPIEQSPPPPPPPLPSGPQFSTPMVVGAITLGAVAVLIVLAVLLGLARMRASAGPALTPTATALTLSTQAALIPTTTPGSQATATNTAPPPTDTRLPPSATPTEAAEAEGTPAIGATAASAALATAAGADEEQLTASAGVNIRAGPSTDYAVIGSLAQGQTANVLGRNAAGTWYVINAAGAPNGLGWVAGSFATYSGDAASLSVIAAPPLSATSAAPPAGATAAAPPPGPQAPQTVTVRGISGRLTLCSAQTTFAVNERVCVLQWIKNNNAETLEYGVMGIRYVNVATNSGGFHTSWNGELAEGGVLKVDPGCEGPVTHPCRGTHEDGARIPSPGSYRVTMDMCLSDFETCVGGQGDWVTLSSPIIITVN